MLICWLIGHRYDYEFKKSDMHGLVCCRCGLIRVLEQIVVAPNKWDIRRGGSAE